VKVVLGRVCHILINAYLLREIRPAVNLNFDTRKAQLVLHFCGIRREFSLGSNDYAGPTPMAPSDLPVPILKPTN
jgi:hypothetical protein